MRAPNRARPYRRLDGVPNVLEHRSVYWLPTHALGLLTWTSGEPRNESTEATPNAE